MATLQKRIIMYRAKHNMSQRAFAAYSGVSESTIVHIETGQKKNVSRMVKAKLELAMSEEQEEHQNEFV